MDKQLAVLAHETVDLHNQEQVETWLGNVSSALAQGVIASSSDYTEAIEIIRTIKSQRKSIKEFFAPIIQASKDTYTDAKALTATSKKAYDASKSRYDALDNKLSTAQDALKNACEEWHARATLARIERLRRASEALQAGLEAGAAAHATSAFDSAVARGDTAMASRLVAGSDAPVATPAVIVAAMASATEIVVDGNDGDVPQIDGVSASVPWTWELIDVDHINREYLTVEPDRAKITKLVRTLGPLAQEHIGTGVIIRRETSLRIRE